MRILLILVLVIGVFRVGEARADFGLTASLVGLGVGVGLVVAAPFIDKSNQESEVEVVEIEDGAEDEEDEFFNLDLSRTALEDLRLKAVGRRGVE